MTTVAPTDTFSIGGNLPVHRLGYGAMQLPGPGVWGEPADPENARRVLRAAVEQAPPLYDDVAASLGSSAADRLRRVTLPLLAPGLGAGAALVFLAVCATDGTLLHANRSALEGCGFDRGTELGRPLWQAGWWAGDPQLQRQVRRRCAQVVAGGGPVRGLAASVRAVRRTGSFSS